MSNLHEKEIRYNDLCNLIANNIKNEDVTVNEVDDVLIGIYKTILEQLQLNQKIMIEKFGTFELKERKAGNREIYDINTKQKKMVYIESKNNIKFTPSDVFETLVNEYDFNFKLVNKLGDVERIRKIKRKKQNKRKIKLKKSRKLYIDADVFNESIVEILEKAESRGAKDNGKAEET